MWIHCMICLILLLVNRRHIRYGLNRETINVLFNKPNVTYSVKRVTSTFHRRCLQLNGGQQRFKSPSRDVHKYNVKNIELKIYVKYHKLLYMNKLSVSLLVLFVLVYVHFRIRARCKMCPQELPLQVREVVQKWDEGSGESVWPQQVPSRTL